MKKAILIVDQYQRFVEAKRSGTSIDADYEAQTLRLLIKPMGREYRCIALISRDDLGGFNAYQRANYEIITYNGDRPQKIREFLIEFIRQLDENPPDQLVLVTADPVFQILCDRISRHENIALSLWSLTKDIPPELSHSAYNARPLDELLPLSHSNRVDVRLDFENLYRVMEKEEWILNMRDILQAIKTATSDLGETVRIVAYADWSVLNRQANKDIQRELALLGVKTRYQVSLKGKNSADMEIVDDIHSLLARDHTEEAVDVIVIGTCDRDFRPVVETIQSRGKRAVVLGIQGNLSSELKTFAQEIRYLDRYSPLPEMIDWITARIKYCLTVKGMPYVDTHYLVKGMINDKRLEKLGISLDWKSAEEWLNLAIKTKKIITKQQSHFSIPGKKIITCWIANDGIINDSFDRDLTLRNSDLRLDMQMQFV